MACDGYEGDKCESYLKRNPISDTRSSIVIEMVILFRGTGRIIVSCKSQISILYAMIDDDPFRILPNILNRLG